MHVPPEKPLVPSEQPRGIPVILEMPATKMQCVAQTVVFDLPLLPQDLLHRLDAERLEADERLAMPLAVSLTELGWRKVLLGDDVPAVQK